MNSLERMDDLLKKLKQREYKTVYAIIPDLRCEEWLKDLEDLGAKWYGISPGDDEKMWQDGLGNKIENQSITWWIARFDS